jgi:hypothetical protein
MKTKQDLYQNLLTRQSIRLYKHNPLGEEELLRIRNLADTVEPLDKKNKYSLLVLEYQPDNPDGKALGGFGRIMTPPYFIAPFITGTFQSLVDLGFRNQQLVLDLWNTGIGSCYVGCAHRQKQVKKLLDVSDQKRIISFVIFGLPENDQSLRLYQKLSRFFTKAQKRFSYNELFLDHHLPEKILKNSLMEKILEAGRFAPSATNAQPWRFEIKENQFTIFAHQKTIANIYDIEQGYSLHDTGICMANMSKAAQALGMTISWHLIDEELINKNSSKQDIPIAYFLLDGLGSTK